jgi:hypothetical protein
VLSFLFTSHPHILLENCRFSTFFHDTEQQQFLKQPWSQAFSRTYSKAVLVTGRGGPQGCGTSRFPHFVHSRLTEGGEVINFMRYALYPAGSFLELIYTRGCVNPNAIVRLEVLGKLKKNYRPSCLYPESIT